MNFHVKKSTSLQDIAETYAKTREMEFDMFRFLFDGERIKIATETVESLRLESEDQIYVVIENRGGS